MDIQKLQALAVIQEAGSFSRAAETLGYSQAGLTYMMNSLENEIGLRLLDRSYSGVRLSETGKTLMPKIHRLLQVYDALNGEINACKGAQQATLRLAALDTVSTRWVPRAVAALKSEYPQITVSVISGSPMQVDNWLRDGSVELGVTDKRFTGTDMDWIRLCDDPFLAVLPPDSDVPDPVPVTWFAGHAVIIPDYGTNTDTTRVFTDSCGREVKVPADIQKVAVSGPLAQMVVFAIAPDKMVGVANAWDKTAENYFDQKYLDLPLLGQLYGGKGELNLETLLAADPDVVIDVGESKSTMAEDLDGLQEQTGIPFVHIDAYLASMDDTYAMLSDLLAMPNEGQALADYCRNAYDTVKAIVDGVEKADVLYITGEEGLNVIARDSYHAEVVDMLCNNLAVVDDPSSKGTGNEVDMEQILNWDPSIVFFAPGSIYSTVADNENWQTIPAIKDGKYYEVPFGPYNWMGFPPSVQRILGMQWMAKVLYPEAADYDMYEVTQTYFQLFYHCDLTIDQYNALVDNSLPAVEAAG